MFPASRFDEILCKMSMEQKQAVFRHLVGANLENPIIPFQMKMLHLQMQQDDPDNEFSLNDKIF